MDAIEKRARQLWQQQYDREGASKLCPTVPGRRFGAHEQLTLLAIIAALTPPEGYVLVPVQPTGAMVEAGDEAEGECKFASEIYSAMLAARPEAPS